MLRARHAAALSILVALLLGLDLAVRSGLVPGMTAAWKTAAWSPAAEAQSAPADPRERRRDATVRAVEKAGPAVANIATERVVIEHFPPGFDEFFREFTGRGAERRTVARSLGSGVIIDPTGYIVTNAHVVQHASKIVVTLPDEREFEANLLSLTYVHDLALLKIDAPVPFTYIRLGTSGDLMMGETMLALGNPFGLENTVTRGVISARDRRIRKDGKELEGTFLQTDAAINPGNSGGPLLNLDGELVGVNTAVHAGGQGIGFAIPVDRVRQVLCELSDPATVRESWLGWQLSDSRAGVRVDRVDAGSPAAAAGIAPGEILEGSGGFLSPTVFDVNKPFLAAPEGTGVKLTIRGADGSRRTATLLPGHSPARDLVERRLGIQGRDLSPAAAWKKGLEIEGGIVVGGLAKDAAAAKIGVEAGDILTKIGRHVVDPRLGQAQFEVTRVTSTAELARVLDSIPRGAEVAIFVLRAGRELQGELKVD